MFAMVHFGSMTTTTPTTQQDIGTDFVKLDTWTTNGISDVDIVPNSVTDTLTIQKVGTYNIIFTCAFKGTNERQYDFSIFVNGVLAPQVQTQRYQGENLVTWDVYAGGIIEVTSIPAVIEARVKCDVDNANVVVVEKATLSCIEIDKDMSCKIIKTSSQSIPSQINTILSWDSELYDTDSMHDNSVNNSRITINTPGKYVIICQSAWGDSSIINLRNVSLLKNGTDIVGVHIDRPVNSNAQTMTWIEDLAVADFIELRVFHNDPQPLDFEALVEPGEGNTYFTVQRLT